MKVFFVLTPAFNPNDGGVQRTTFKLGKFFSENGISVYYFSFAVTGHIQPEFGTLFHAKERGSASNLQNIHLLKTELVRTVPDIVINQMPYEKMLRQALYTSRQQVGFVLLGCLRNSLFSFKSNVRDIVKNNFKGIKGVVMGSAPVIKLLLAKHKISHGNDLKEIIDFHDRFILLTPKNREELEYFVGNYKSEKVIAIPNSIPAVYNAALQKEKVLLYVGRLNIPQKRADLIGPVWKQVQHSLTDWKLVVVGDGEYLSSFKAYIEENQLQRVELKGHAKPEQYYEQSAVFFMTSAYEGFPNVIIEAQSFGCVPVAFDSYASLSWIVNDRSDSILVKPFNTTAMANEIVGLANDAVKMQDMQQAALRNAGKFTIDEVGKIWLDLFKRELEVKS